MSATVGVGLLRRLWKNRAALLPILEAIEKVIDVARITIEVRRRKADGVQRYDLISIDAEAEIDEGLEEIDDFEKRRGG